MRQLPTQVTTSPTPSAEDSSARSQLADIAAEYGLRLVSARSGSGLARLATEAILMRRERLVIVPPGQGAAETLPQLRAALEAQAQEIRLARDFEASVAAGHVEDVETWYARTCSGGAV
jgi:gamma-glutamyl:cysteine ligase YbdK (ATP-grasp superfamily)